MADNTQKDTVAPLVPVVQYPTVGNGLSQQSAPVQTPPTEIVEKPPAMQESITDDIFQLIMEQFKKHGRITLALNDLQIPYSTFYYYIHNHIKKLEYYEKVKLITEDNFVDDAKDNLKAALRSNDEKIKIDVSKFVVNKYDKTGNTNQVQSNTQVNIFNDLKREFGFERKEDIKVEVEKDGAKI